MKYADSTNQRIKIDDKVMFRGQIYTIKRFGKRTDRGYQIFFYGKEQHTTEVATESSVQLVNVGTKQEEFKMRIGADVENKQVLVDFGKPIKGLSFSPDEAIELARLLVDAAGKVADGQP